MTAGIEADVPGVSCANCEACCCRLEVILMGDYRTKRLIDAERAVWVIGGKKMGIMSIRGKWAFENRKDADAFMRENGGHISSFDEAMKITFEDMYEIIR